MLAAHSNMKGYIAKIIIKIIITGRIHIHIHWKYRIKGEVNHLICITTASQVLMTIHSLATLLDLFI